MEKTKKMSKLSIAVIVLSILLVLSMVMGMTGAWFTWKDQGDGAKVDFGVVKLQKTAENVAFVDHGVTTLTGALMPGDDILVKMTLTNGANNHDYNNDEILEHDAVEKFYYVIKITITGLGSYNNGGNGANPVNSAWCVQTGTGSARTLSPVTATGNDKGKELVDITSVEIESRYVLDGQYYGNTYQDADVTIHYEVRAIQVKNLTKSQAYDLLTTEAYADFPDNTSASPYYAE